jgi:Ca2+-binding RTX toxin-like protein
MGTTHALSPVPPIALCWLDIGSKYMSDSIDVTQVVTSVVDDVSNFVIHHTVTATATSFSLSYGEDVLTFTGTGLTYSGGLLVGGTITEVSDVHEGETRFDATGLSISVQDMLSLVAHNATPAAIAEALPGNDLLQGGASDDVLSLAGSHGHHEIRALDGNDSVTAGSDGDDINGNKGDDTLQGGGGDDTLSGGQGNDLIEGKHGHGSFNGNIGDDTLQAGDGGDILHGGQGNDLLIGGAGNDMLWGDRGDDTLTGGQGADVFHFSSAGGHDVITDFNAAEGDKLAIDHSDNVTVSDTTDGAVVTLQGGETITLLGVHVTSLPSDWIFQD